jgi:8-oxo-dGTP diphosphatase
MLGIILTGLGIAEAPAALYVVVRRVAVMTEAERHCYAYPHPALTTDVALFTILDDELQLLLVRRGRAPFAGTWALPGGFLDMDEDLDQCAARELAEETGLDGSALGLEQFHTFGAVHRDPRERVISVAYLALAPPDGLCIQAGDDAADTRWFPLDALPDLAFDHDQVIGHAQQRLRERLSDSTLAFRLLPDRFTLEELRRVYERLLGAELDARHAAHWNNALANIEPNDEQREVHGRPARLYRLRQTKRGDSSHAQNTHQQT